MTHPTAPHSVRDAHAVAFHRVRIALGLLGFALPLALALAGLWVDGRVQPSISDFFHTSARDLFVGGLTAIAIFLVTHQGTGGGDHGKSRLGAIFAMLAGVSALGVALVPNEAEAVTTLSQELLGLKRAPALHYGSATLFYLMMSLTCLMIYARQTTGWEKRFHKAMGWTVWCTGWAVMLLTYFKRGGAGPELQAFTEANNLIFWDESLGVWAFCLSWLVQAHMEFKRAVKKASMGTRDHARLAPTPQDWRGTAPSPGPGGRLISGFAQTLTAPFSALFAGNGAPTAPLPQAFQEDPMPSQTVMMRRHHRSSTHARAMDVARRAPAQTGLQRRG